jgi:energy-coupling factor transporter ATP-binding protein EcfA2
VECRKKADYWRIGSRLALSMHELKSRIDKKKASMMLVDGQVGFGKTTLAVAAADYYQGSEIDLDLQLAMGFDEFVKKLDLCVKKGKCVLVYDESGDADKRGAMSKLNRFLNRIFDTFRAFKILIIMVLPNFSILESQLFLKAIPRVLAHIEYRDENKGMYRLFSLYNMMWIKHHMSKLVIPFDAYNRVSTDHTGTFHDLDPKRSAELDLISTTAKKKILEEYANDVYEKEDIEFEDNKKNTNKKENLVTAQIIAQGYRQRINTNGGLT